jgi:phage shock protein A
LEYESKAVAILQKAQSGAIDATEADRLAQSALEKKEEFSKNLASSLGNQKKYEDSVAKLEAQIKKLKSNISNWENEAKILKARAKVSDATASVNKQLAGIDSNSTVAMLERMKEKVEQKEALSESYAEIASSNVSVDEEINNVLESSNANASDALAALKQKMALKGGDATDVK